MYALYQFILYCLYIVTLRFVIFQRKLQISLQITIIRKFSRLKKCSHIVTNFLSLSIIYTKHRIFNSSLCRTIFSTIYNKHLCLL